MELELRACLSVIIGFGVFVKLLLQHNLLSINKIYRMLSFIGLALISKGNLRCAQREHWQMCSALCCCALSWPFECGPKVMTIAAIV